MNDRDFLMWLHERLEKVHGEDACYDYMHKLRAIIKATPANKVTPNMGTGNSLDDTRRDLGLKAANVEFSGGAPLHGAASDGTQGSASCDSRLLIGNGT